jgi:hypothetical protein
MSMNDDDDGLNELPLAILRLDGNGEILKLIQSSLKITIGSDLIGMKITQVIVNNLVLSCYLMKIYR